MTTKWFRFKTVQKNLILKASEPKRVRNALKVISTVYVYSCLYDDYNTFQPAAWVAVL